MREISKYSIGLSSDFEALGSGSSEASETDDVVDSDLDSRDPRHWWRQWWKNADVPRVFKVFSICDFICG